MPVRRVVLVLVVLAAILGVAVWKSQMQRAETPEAAAPAMPPETQGQGGGTSMGGQQVVAPPDDASPELAWKVPANWSTQPPRPMRLATYGIPALAGDAEGAECGVFYFGPTQGGTADDNIARWVAQFEDPGPPERAEATVAGFRVERVHITGTYLAPSGPMMESSGAKPGWALLGAIVEGPAGRVFFKLTGPAKTVDGSKPEFDRLLLSMKKSGS